MKRSQLQKKKMPEIVKRGTVNMHGVQPGTTMYTMGKCRILISPPYIAQGIGYHMSISHTSRYPTWDEISHARYQLLPDNITMAMLLPPTEQYVNLHERTFHLHQIPNEK